ncbi:hypothetical protein D3C71_1426200 [compost metagenome]
MPSIMAICKFYRKRCDFFVLPLWPRVFRGLPAEGFLEKRNGELALCLQRRLIEALEQVEQRAHAPRAAGEDEMADFVGQVQATARSSQLQGAQLVFVGQAAHLEHQRQGQPRLQVRQLDRQLTR